MKEFVDYEQIQTQLINGKLKPLLIADVRKNDTKRNPQPEFELILEQNTLDRG